jgi:hypothetical protein
LTFILFHLQLELPSNTNTSEFIEKLACFMEQLTLFSCFDSPFFKYYAPSILWLSMQIYPLTIFFLISWAPWFFGILWFLVVLIQGKTLLLTRNCEEKWGQHTLKPYTLDTLGLVQTDYAPGMKINAFLNITFYIQCPSWLQRPCPSLACLSQKLCCC